MTVVNEVLPDFLAKPQEPEYTYGTLSYDRTTDSWVIKGEPVVCQLAKRLFPGSSGRGKGIARFKNHKRINGDLNWLMLRYPLEIVDNQKWEEEYKKTVSHVLKRNELIKNPTKITPSQVNFKGTLREFQKEAVSFLRNNAPCLLFDEMGLGKTIEALGWVADLDQYPGVIVAPPAVIKQWEREIKKFIVPKDNQPQLSLFPEDNMVHVIKGLKPYDLPPASFYLIHYGLLRGWKNVLPEKNFKFVVFDEIQELRRAQSEKYSAASLLAESCENTIGMSGTPIYNRGGEIWNVTNIIDLNCLGDWDSFTREWCYGYGSDIVSDPALLGGHLKREGLMLRRKKEEVLDELPEKRRIVQEIDTDHSLYNKLMKKVYDTIPDYDLIEDHLEKGRVKRWIGEEARRATGISKAPYVAAFIKLLLDAGESVVLYGYHHSVYEIWLEELKQFNPVKVTGQENQKQKDEAVQSFIRGDTNLIIISLRAAAGLDGLQHRSKINVFGELDWSPGVHAQCEDRTHRIGQRDSVINYYLVCSEGSDNQMMDAIGLKTSQFVGIMGDELSNATDDSINQVEVGKHLDHVIEQIKKNKSKT